MRILVDADSCPIPIKEILYRAAERVKIKIILVANQPMRHPRSKWIEFIQVRSGPNEADIRILKILKRGDLVITADIPLASKVVSKKGLALGTRGEVYNKDNMIARLAIRNKIEQVRIANDESFGPRPMKIRDRREFANQLDRILTIHQNKKINTASLNETPTSSSENQSLT